MSTGMQSDPGTGHVPSSDMGSGAQNAAREAAVAAKERAGAMWDDTKESARSRLNEQKDAAADRLGGVAESLRGTARGTGEGNEAISRLAESAAEGLERLSNRLRNKDVNDMLRDIDSFARNQPIAFFGIALAVGFVAVRAVRDIGAVEH